MTRFSRLVVLAAALLSAAAPLVAQTKYVRFSREENVAYGILRGDSIAELRGDLLTTRQPTGRVFALAEVQLLAPIDPSDVHKVIGVAINTLGAGREGPIPNPRFFAKFPTSIVGPGDSVELSPEAGNLNYEGELVLVIGKEGRHVPEDEALDHVFGVTVGNDFSENTWYGERRGVEDPTRMISKGADTWAPIGPTIVTGVDFTDLAVVVRMNGEVVQRGRTSELANKAPNLVSYISRYVTLEPGDLIFTGTVGRVEGARRAVRVGDVIDVEIEGLGVLRNVIKPMEMETEERNSSDCLGPPDRSPPDSHDEHVHGPRAGRTGHPRRLSRRPALAQAPAQRLDRRAGIGYSCRFPGPRLDRTSAAHADGA